MQAKEKKAETLVDLQGQIERVTYTNDENGFTIAKLKVYGQKELVTIVGNLMAPTPGEIIRMRGEWTNHPKYGEQFKIVQYKSMVPASVYGIEKYLGSGLIRGIGPVMAKRIVQVFGKETLEVIEKDVEKLSEVHGIGKKRIGMIKKAWEEQKEIREVMLFLQTHGVSSGYATKIFKQYGNSSIEVVKENPYRLAMDIFGIGFLTADRIAEKLGFAKDSEVRAEAGILYVLHQLSDEGHVYYPYEPLIEKCQEILEVERDVITKALGTIAAQEKIVIEDLDEEAGKKAVYLAKFHFSETNTAARLRTLLNASKSIRKIDSQKAVEWVQGQLSIALAEKQIEAVKTAIENKVMVITGGPGTGKTTIINAILKIFSKLNVGILLAAPTGRAAKRMSEATGYEAKTIHRMLEYSIQKGGFQKDIELRPNMRATLDRQRGLTEGFQTPYVFVNSEGRPIQQENLGKIWRRALSKSGVRYRRLYETRHTFASWALAAGGSPEWVAKTLGHVDTTMIYRTYGCYIPHLTRKDGSAF